MASNLNLAGPFFDSAKLHPDSLAICADGRECTYREARSVVQNVANWLQKTGDGPPHYVGILASRSWEACVGILGTACSGAAYVALNLSQPAAALAQLLRGIQLDALIVDRAGVRLLTPEVLEHAPRRVLVPAGCELAKNGGHSIQTFETLETDCNCEPRSVAAEDPAYVEFTSGSTGTPKGVIIPNGAVAHFLGVMQRRYAFQPGDRIAETADTSFDISVFNMFMSWSAGASLHVVPKTQAIAPAKFIRDHAITVWFSVPSSSAAMSRMNLLSPGTFPSLRVSLFSGEPLPAKVAMAWKKAAPNSVVDNLYGPTEATVICLYERVEETPNITKERDIVAIGRPLEGTEVAIWDSAGNCILNGSVGEIVLSGPQLSLGYLNDPDKTEARFVTKDAKRWYLTGDLGYRDESGLLHHLGRMDNQVKVLGNRVELEEVEMHLRQIYKSDSVAAVAWPIEFGSATGIVGFVSGPKALSSDATELRKRLPSYMVPSVVHVVDVLPSNSSGKVDRKVLAQKLKKGEF
jgi:D-alanine--poly(phosphoribitol) ligase subunit 1